jgi:hypothetical protein
MAFEDMTRRLKPALHKKGWIRNFNLISSKNDSVKNDSVILFHQLGSVDLKFGI